MKQRLTMWYAALVAWMIPVVAWAADEDPSAREARIENYAKDIPSKLPEGGTFMTWVFFWFLALCCMAVLFKNAKRTHLD